MLNLRPKNHETSLPFDSLPFPSFRENNLNSNSKGSEGGSIIVNHDVKVKLTNNNLTSTSSSSIFNPIPKFVSNPMTRVTTKPINKVTSVPVSKTNTMDKPKDTNAIDYINNFNASLIVNKDAPLKDKITYDKLTKPSSIFIPRVNLMPIPKVSLTPVPRVITTPIAKVTSIVVEKINLTPTPKVTSIPAPKVSSTSEPEVLRIPRMISVPKFKLPNTSLNAPLPAFINIHNAKYNSNKPTVMNFTHKLPTTNIKLQFKIPDPPKNKKKKGKMPKQITNLSSQSTKVVSKNINISTLICDDEQSSMSLINDDSVKNVKSYTPSIPTENDINCIKCLSIIEGPYLASASNSKIIVCLRCSSEITVRDYGNYYPPLQLNLLSPKVVKLDYTCVDISKSLPTHTGNYGSYILPPRKDFSNIETIIK